MLTSNGNICQDDMKCVLATVYTRFCDVNTFRHAFNSRYPDVNIEPTVFEAENVPQISIQDYINRFVNVFISPLNTDKDLE